MRKKIVFLGVIAIMAILTLAGVSTVSSSNGDPGPPSGNGIEPVYVPGNPTCGCLGYGDYERKIEPVVSGTYNIDGTNTITIVVSGSYVDWTSTIGIDSVVVKGGPNANLYVYDPEASSDTDLHAPINPHSGQVYGLSHISFCYDYEVEVTKTAQTFFTRTWDWDINKAVTPDQWDLFRGDSGTSQYTVAVTKTGYTDSAWRVEGSITIHNPAPGPALITDVSDMISGVGEATVNLGVSLPYVLPAGSTLTASYQADLPDGTSRTNTVIVDTCKSCCYKVGGGSGTAEVIFGAPTTEVNDTIHVSDTNGGSWQFSDTASVSYTQAFACDDDCGVHTNTATIVETGQSDSATVAVNCYELEITKTAQPSYERKYYWDIDKWADQTELTLSIGQMFLVNYAVAVDTNIYVDSGWGVNGVISVGNPAPIPATINSISDLVSPDIVATVDCGCIIFPYTLPPGAVLECAYSTDLPNKLARTNTATAVLQNYDYDYLLSPTASGETSFSGEVDVVFGGPTELVDECIDVSDTYAGFLGTVCYNDVLPKTFTYSRWIGPYAACGNYVVTNIASFVTNDTGSTGSDDWTVNIDVPCVGGCTRTQGYWKTHSKYGPAAHPDDTWNLVGGPDTTFFLSGQSWYEVFWTPPKKGNAYYILAHQYMAARLNILSGAASLPEVDSAIAWATNFFNNYTPDERLKGGLRRTVIAKAELLTRYNEGSIGPGHCPD